MRKRRTGFGKLGGSGAARIGGSGARALALPEAAPRVGQAIYDSKQWKRLRATIRRERKACERCGATIEKSKSGCDGTGGPGRSRPGVTAPGRTCAPEGVEILRASASAPRILSWSDCESIPKNGLLHRSARDLCSHPERGEGPTVAVLQSVKDDRSFVAVLLRMTRSEPGSLIILSVSEGCAFE